MVTSTDAPVRGRDFGDLFTNVTRYYQKQATDEIQLKRLRPRFYFTDPKINEQAQNSKQVHGDILLQRIRHYLAKMPVERHADQKRFHEEFLRAVAPGLYGPAFDTEYPRILKQNQWEKGGVRTQAMIITPRRWGKTYCVAMFVAAYLWAVPNAVQCIFSTSARISQMILELIYRFFISFEGARERIIKYSTETLWVRGDSPGDIRKLYSYPSNEKIWSYLSKSCDLWGLCVYFYGFGAWGCIKAISYFSRSFEHWFYDWDLERPWNQVRFFLQ